CSTNRYDLGPLSGSLSESPMPIRAGAMQRPRGRRCGNTLRQRYDEVGLPCSSTMGSPCPSSTYAISLPRTRRRCFLYGNAAEIMCASPSLVVVPLSLLAIDRLAPFAGKKPQGGSRFRSGPKKFLGCDRNRANARPV